MEALSQESIAKIIARMKELNYQVFYRPNQLNIIGVRTATVVPNKFDDNMFVFWMNDNGSFEGRKYPVTTDTGTFWLKNPKEQNGSALLKAGQYIDSWQKGFHNRNEPTKRYPALVQAKPITVFRDYNKDNVLDFDGKEQTGLFGINIHRVNPSATSTTVDRWSAGCQVFANPNDFADFMKLVDKHIASVGNAFTYTLVDNRWSTFYT